MRNILTNSTFAKSSGSMLRRHICGENRHLCQALNHYTIQNAKNDTIHKNITDNSLFDFYGSDKSGFVG
jgi:hypothetical protein